MEPDSWLGVEVRHLAALQALAAEHSFGRAARRLGYTQSAVSQQIATLERIVGERLVERPGGPRPVSLTEAGELLLRHAESIVARLKAAQADLHALRAGEVGTRRVGVFQSVGARVLPGLRGLAEYPLVGFRHTVASDQVVAAFRAEGVEPRWAFRSNDNPTIQGLVAAGIGVAVMPRLTVDTQDPRIAVVDLHGAVPSRIIAIAQHRDRYNSPSARAFVETAREIAATRP